MDHKKLAEALRLFVMANKYPTPARLLEAADRIEALTAQLAESERQRAAAVEKSIQWGAKLIEFGEAGAHASYCPECGYPIADYGVNEDIYCSWCGTKSASTMFTPAGAGYCTTSIDRKSKVFDRLLLRESCPKESAKNKHQPTPSWAAQFERRFIRSEEATHGKD